MTTRLPKNPSHAVHPADIRGDLVHLETSFCKTEFGAVPTNNVGVHHQYRRWVHFGIQHYAHHWWIHQSEASHATIWGWGSATVVLKDTTACNPLYEGQVPVAWCGSLSSKVGRINKGVTWSHTDRFQGCPSIWSGNVNSTLKGGALKKGWDHWSQEYNKEGTPMKGPWCSRWVAIWRKQFGNITARTNPWILKAICYHD